MNREHAIGTGRKPESLLPESAEIRTELEGVFSQLRHPIDQLIEVNLQRLQGLLLTSAQQIALGQQIAGERTLIQAMRLALSHRQRSEPIVGETLLQASQLFLERSVRHGALASFPVLAHTLFENALRSFRGGQSTDSGLEPRIELLRHRLEHRTPHQREFAIVKEVELTLAAIHSEALPPVAAAHLAVTALGTVRFLDSCDAPEVLPLALCEASYKLCASVLGISDSLTNAIRAEHAEIQFQRALKLPREIERTGEIRLMVGSLTQAIELYSRTPSPDAKLLGKMNYLLSAANLSDEINDIAAAAEAINRLQRILENSRTPDGQQVQQLLTVADLLNRRMLTSLTAEEQADDEQLNVHAKRVHFLANMLARIIDLAERSPELNQSPEYMGYLYTSYAASRMRLGHYSQVLQTAETFYNLELSPFSKDRLNMLFFEHTAALYCGHYQRAHKAASSILDITSGFDPMRLDTDDFVGTRLKLLGKSTEHELAWGLKLAREMTPLISLISNELQRPLALINAQLNALAGRSADAATWLDAFDSHVLTKRNMTFSDHIRKLMEQYEPRDYFGEEDPNQSTQSYFDLEEIVIRCTTELMRESPDLKMLFGAIELFQQIEDAGALQEVTDPRLRASLSLIEGRFWLLRKETERARNCFMQALKPLESDLPLLHYHQAAILFSMGESYAHDGDFEQSNRSLRAAKELFEGLPSPTIELANVYRRLMLNQEAIGNTEDQTVYFEEYLATVRGLSQMPQIDRPEATPGLT